MAEIVRVLREDDVRAALPMSVCIDAVERAFVAYSAGRAEMPGVIHLDVPEAGGEIHIKAGHLHGAPAYALKASSGFAGDPPAIDGLVVVFDATTGAPLAFLLDRGFVTDQRTGAAGGVAARWLAPERVGRVAVLGSGIQARKQVEALRAVRVDVGPIRVWARDAGRAAAAAADVGGRAVGSVEEAVEGADVILTCTAAREPLVRAGWVASGALVIAVGSDGPGKQELDPDLLRRADVLVVDALDQALRLGELQHAPELRERAVELGVICAGGAPGRTSADQLIVCDLTGVGVQDVAAANAVLANAGDAGERLER
ncbi:MAG TPA: ornithine cyclodeaminase family protein [Actinomycetota bacterium]|nr:ornithine cyclodeaminase family protein [Actinomycetota bacterium]